MNEWQQDSWWFQPHLGIDRVAGLLDIQPASVRRYLTDHSGFPEPADQRANRNYWTPAAIYRYIWDTKPEQRQRIPRLCPLTDDIAAAVFIESEIIQTRGLIYVLHTWEPGDGRGRVGVAYSKDRLSGDDQTPQHLLSLRPHLSAITLPKGLTGLQDPRQPRIAVADHAGIDLYPYEAGWLDLTALLQVDLPWWSRGLTDIEAMNAWRPGTPVAHARPQAADFTSHHIERCRPHDGSQTDRALAELAESTDRALAVAFDIWPDGHDDFPNRTGLRHAAIATLNPHAPAPAALQVIRHALGHHIGDKDLAVRAIYTARSFEVLLPAVTLELLTIDRDQCSRLAHEWCHRLTPIAPEDRDEIGFHWVTHHMDNPPHQWWRDPLNPDVWAVTDTEGTLHTTFGSQMPARGRIEEVAIEDHRPFFRDSSGNTFPVPSSDGTTHRTLGSSATRLTAAILALMDDATQDVYRCATHIDPLDIEATGLYDVISERQDTIILSRNDLEQLRHETTHGAARRDAVKAMVARFRDPDGGVLAS